MVTRYDVFEFVYSYRHTIKPIEVVGHFKKNESEYDNIHRMLSELTDEGLLTKTSYGFQAKKSEKSDLLYQIIYHCLRNDIAYNDLLNSELVRFLSRALQKKEVTSDTANLNPITFRKYINILSDNGLALIISEKPLRVKVFYNILINNILVYFDYKHFVITDDNTEYLEEIQKELKVFRGLKRRKFAQYEKLISEFEISFIQHSLSLEGNPVTLSQTKNILRDKVIPANLKLEDVEEVKNYHQALLQMLADTSNRRPLTLDTILKYHGLAMQHRPEIAGKIRKIEVYIKGNLLFKITKAKNIEKELQVLIEKYNNFNKKNKPTIKELLDFAVYFHNDFQHIHPFEDGNSRTTRLITFYLLQSKDIPILDIPFGLLDEYLSSTKGSKKRKDRELHKNLQKIVLYNLKKVNKKLG